MRGGWSLPVPDWASPEIRAVPLSAIAMPLMPGAKVKLPPTPGPATLAGVAIFPVKLT